MRICNSREPDAPGTLIDDRREPSAVGIKAIAHKRGITVVQVTAARMLGAQLMHRGHCGGKLVERRSRRRGEFLDADGSRPGDRGIPSHRCQGGRMSGGEASMRDLLQDYDRLSGEGERLGRAVVTSVWGSAPRPEGSSMLATAGGVMAGSTVMAICSWPAAARTSSTAAA